LLLPIGLQRRAHRHLRLHLAFFVVILSSFNWLTRVIGVELFQLKQERIEPVEISRQAHLNRCSLYPPERSLLKRLDGPLV